MARALDVEYLIGPDQLASEISQRFETWSSFRRTWVNEKKELRNYVYATDTKTTTNNKNGWANSTTTPKITQIYDNLKANYEAALFPRDVNFKFQAGNAEASSTTKASTVQSYMEAKVRQSGFRTTVDRLVDDWVLTGNAFATVDYVREETVLESGEVLTGYVGPAVVRIPPYDIAFDPTVAEFKNSPKIVRTFKTLGELAVSAETDQYAKETFDKIMHNRSEVGMSGGQTEKSAGYIADGFSSIENYYESSMVECLTFYGDIFDKSTNKVQVNRLITIIDRAYVISNVPNPSWLGTAPVFHVGWRSRPDNLYGMGPLDNLVGLQYRIDHLENMKADVFDLIASPVLKVKGEVEDFVYAPGAKIILGEEGDVGFLVPDATALNADMQIQGLEYKMEEIAGAPRQAMGFRTPGEKTAFEVDSLSQAANRIFNHKAARFEMEFLEPILNAMLEAARREMNTYETVSSLDENTGAILFQEITKEDITSKGTIVPYGARYFAESARRIQTLQQLIGIKANMPDVGVHFSGFTIARIISEEIKEPGLFGQNVQVEETLETQKIVNDAAVDLEEDQQLKAEEGF
tara:strand:- start:1422 stop:3155 length:1734 start_codon:yes stop_codon:yes gene_type:complete